MGARASGPLMVMVFRTARVSRLMIMRRATRAVRKIMSGPEARAPVTWAY